MSDGFASRRYFTLRELLVLVGILGIGLGIAVPLVQRARERARRDTCRNNVHEWVLGTHNFHDSIRSLPPARLDEARAAGVSNTDISVASSLGPNWAVLIMPFVDSNLISDSFQLNRRAPIANASHTATYTPPATNPYMWRPDALDPYALPSGSSLLRSMRSKMLTCPTDDRHDVPFSGNAGGYAGGWARTNYAINAGPCELMIGGGDSPCDLNGGKPPFGLRAAGVSAVNYGVNLDELRNQDGSTQTALVLEVRVGLVPEDIRGTWLLGYPGASVVANAAVGDVTGPNSPSATGDDIDGCAKAQAAAGGTQKLARMGMGCNAAATGSSQAGARSAHAGVTNIGMADASVREVADDIDPRVWFRMLSRVDGEQVDAPAP